MFHEYLLAEYVDGVGVFVLPGEADGSAGLDFAGEYVTRFHTTWSLPRRSRSTSKT